MINPDIAEKEAAEEVKIMSIKDRLVDMIYNDPNLPTLGSSISTVVQFTSTEGGSLDKLTGFILSDPSLTVKILRLSNSITYRSGSAVVTSISTAIQLLGMETIKACALAMILVDGMPSKHAKAVRTELMLSLSASLIGRNLAKRSNFPNAEEVTIAALFKNLGRLVLAAFDDKLYRETMMLAGDKGYTESSASLEKLGCTFSWLTEFALKTWHIPDSIIQAMKIIPGKVLKSPKNRGEWMQQVAEFSNSAALLSLQGGEIRDSSLSDVLERFGQALNLDSCKLNALVDESTEKVREIIVNFGDANKAKSEDKVNSTELEDNELNCTAAGFGDIDIWINRAEDCYSSGKPFNAADQLLSGVQKISEILSSQNVNINSLLKLALQTYHRSLGFRFVTACFKDVQMNQFKARSFEGTDREKIQKGFAFPHSKSSDLFNLAINQNIDLNICDATESKINGALPNWHKRLLPDTKSFMILPLVVRDKPIGLIYADRSAVAREGITVNEMKLIKSLKAKILMAMSL